MAGRRWPCVAHYYRVCDVRRRAAGTGAAVFWTRRARKNLRIATAESCTGGLIAGLLTEIPGSSDVVERGFVTYSNEAKEDMLGVPRRSDRRHGAVSEAVARAMAEGALKHSHAQMAVAVTGIAGPGGGTAEKPVGLVYIAAARDGRAIAARSTASAISAASRSPPRKRAPKR